MIYREIVTTYPDRFAKIAEVLEMDDCLLAGFGSHRFTDFGPSENLRKQNRWFKPDYREAH